MPTTHSIFATLTLLTLTAACAEPGTLNTNVTPKGGNTSTASGGGTSTDTSSGGSTTTTTSSNGGATTTSSGGSTGTTSSTAKGGTTGTTTSTSSGGTTTTTTSTTPSNCGTTTDELTMTYTPQLGGDRFGGTVKIVPKGANTFPASDIVVKFCVTVMGPGTATMDASNITLYDASIQGQPYVSIKDIKGAIENTDARYCIVLDVNTVAAAASRTMTSADTMNLDWRYTSLNFGTGMMVDPTPGNEPVILVSRAGTLAACQQTEI